MQLFIFPGPVFQNISSDLVLPVPVHTVSAGAPVYQLLATDKDNAPNNITYELLTKTSNFTLNGNKLLATRGTVVVGVSSELRFR